MNPQNADVKSQSGAQTISFMNLMVGWICKICVKEEPSDLEVEEYDLKRGDIVLVFANDNAK